MSKTDNARVVPISNLPKVVDTNDDLPDKYKLEIYRLTAKLRNLEADIKDKDNRLLKALTSLNDELLFWRTGLHNHVWESMGEINKRMNRLAVTIEQIKDPQPRVIPPLELPARWTNKS